VHAVELAPEYLPMLQEVQILELVSKYLPALQLVQKLWPVPEYEPVGQVVATGGLPVQKEPAVQFVQAQFDTYWPAEHDAGQFLGQNCHSGL
jgi:hypothetical protein